MRKLLLMAGAFCASCAGASELPSFNCLSTGTMAASGRVAGNWMSWVSISNKKLIDRGIRLLIELGGVDYEEAAKRIFAAEEWVASQDWTGKEEPCAVQVALERIRKERK